MLLERLASGVTPFDRQSRSGYARRVLLSDRDLRAEIAAGRLGIDPFDDALVQPSSVDVRLDSLFRVFNNTRYTHIDPAQQQDELTSLVEPAEGEPFVLHPGEFVLGSTLELCTLPEDLAGRLEGKSSLGRLGLLTHSTAGFIDPGLQRSHHAGAVQRRQPADHAVAGYEDRSALHPAPDQPGRTSLRQRVGWLEVSGSARTDAVSVVSKFHKVHLSSAVSPHSFHSEYL